MNRMDDLNNRNEVSALLAPRIRWDVPRWATHLLLALTLYHPVMAQFKESAIPSGGKAITEGLAEMGDLKETRPTGSLTTVDLTGEAYPRAIRLEVSDKGGKGAFNYEYPFKAQVKAGDVLLLQVVARSLSSKNESGECLVKACLEPTGGIWAPKYKQDAVVQKKLLDAGFFKNTVVIQTDKNWKEYFLSLTAPVDMAAEDLCVFFRAGGFSQTVDLGKVAVFNYGKGFPIETLPVTRYTYPGREASAPWRKEAEERIRKYRMGTVQVTVVDAAGKPVPAAQVEVTTVEQAYDFGCAIDAFQVTSLSPDAERFKNKLHEYFFNEVSFCNSLKWMGMNGEWGEAFDFEKVTVPAMEWIRSAGLRTRGHTLIWPSSKHVPKNLKDLLGRNPVDPEAVRKMTMDRVVDGITRTKPWIKEWDVINESIPENEIMEKVGYDIMADWMKKAKEVLPDGIFAINEYAILTAPAEGSAKQEAHEGRIRMLQEAHAPLDLLGFQGHFPGVPNGPEIILKHLGRFARFKVPVRITEFDMTSDDPEMISDFYRDFITLMYSHPITVGVQLWVPFRYFFRDFKDTYQKKPSTDYAWVEMPVAKMFKELVGEKFWTRAGGKTDGGGIYAVPAHLGKLQVRVHTGGRTQEKIVDLGTAGGTAQVRIIF